MIQFPNRNPFEFCVSSGALGFDGRGYWWEQPLRWVGLIDPKAFVIVAKTVTLYPCAGNLRMHHPWTCVRMLPGMATTNAVGLTNPGLSVWLKRDFKRAFDDGYLLAPSVAPFSKVAAQRMAESFDEWPFPYIEVNVSCPNTIGHDIDGARDILTEIKAVGVPIVLKLAYLQVDEPFITAVDGLVDGYHAVNSLPWDVVYYGWISPIQRYAHGLKGGVSGPPIKRYAVEAVQRLTRMTTKPIIGGGGIFSTADVLEFKAAGASAFSFGTCFLHRPWRPNRIVRDYQRRQR